MLLKKIINLLLIMDKVYVFAGNYSEFLEYKNNNKDSDHDFEFIVDGETLRGRGSGKIVRYGSYDQRWDYIAVEDSIEAAEKIWEKQEKEKKKGGLDYGI